MTHARARTVHLVVAAVAWSAVVLQLALYGWLDRRLRPAPAGSRHA